MAKTLLDFGDRVQESVFECRLDETRIDRLLNRLEKIVAGEDSVRIYALCAKCEKTITKMGRQDISKSEKVLIV
jgi:CRISPR-associated protein Cas2